MLLYIGIILHNFDRYARNTSLISTNKNKKGQHGKEKSTSLCLILTVKHYTILLEVAYLIAKVAVFNQNILNLSRLMGCCASKKQMVAGRPKERPEPNPETPKTAPKEKPQPTQDAPRISSIKVNRETIFKQTSQQTEEQKRLSILLAPLKKQIPNIKCPQGNKVVTICMNPSCNNSFRCLNESCKSCGSLVHSVCQSRSLQELTDIINGKTEDCRNLIVRVIKIQQEYIAAIHRQQEDLVSKMVTYISQSLNQSTIESVQKIYTDQNYQKLNGKEAMDLCMQLDKKTHFSMSQKYLRIERYASDLQEKLSKMQEMKTLCFLTDVVEIDSDVLKLRNKLAIDMPFINQALGHPESLQLIYRASQHNFSAAAFHRLCDGIEDTFILVRTEFGKTIAGFTHYKWEKRLQKGGWLDDTQKRSFLLQLDLHQKMLPIQHEKLIYYSKDEGPAFGYGADLSLGDCCNIKSNSYADFPTTYNCEAPYQYVNDQNSFKAFSGAKRGNNFKVIQYQVFKVKWYQK